MKLEAQCAPAPLDPVKPGAVSALLRELAVVAAPPDDATPDLQPGERVGRFEILRELGRGGFAVVYEARDTTLGRSVAFKVVRMGRRTPELKELLLVEAEAAARLSHPNIVTLFDVGRCPQGPYLVLELLRGESLSARLERGPLALDEALRVAIGIARGMAHAHARGIVHRDLAPGNVFLCEDGGVKVLDFGLAHAFGRERTPGGTPAYAAPEQWRGASEDERADVFALGVMLYQMLSGKLPFGQGERQRATQVAPELELPEAPEVGALVARMISRDPAHRPRNGSEVLAELEPVQARLAGTPVPAPAPRGPAWPARRGRRTAWIAAVAVAAVFAAGAVLWIRARAGRDAAGARPERVVLAVADLANRTGDADLDAVAGLLATSLEQSRRLDVLPRARLLDLLSVAAPGAPERLDERRALETARLAGANAALLTTLYRFDAVYVADVRAVDPGSGRSLFSIKEQGRSKEDIPELMDRVSADVRRAFGHDEREIRVDSVRLGDVTPNLEAWRHYFRGLECFQRSQFAGTYDRCLHDYERAVAVDPSFALAHLAISQLSFMQGLPRAVQRSALAPALANMQRIPPRDRLRIRGWAAYLDGDDAEAKSLLRRAAEEARDDKLVWWLAGEIAYHRDEFAEAVPLFQRVHAIDPAWLDVSYHLAFALGATGRIDEVRSLAAGLAAIDAPQALPALCYAQLWSDVARAVGTCDRAVAAGASEADQFLAIALLARGERSRLEAHLRRMEHAQTGLGFAWFMTLLLRAQEGRWPEVIRLADSAKDPEYSWFHGTYAEALVGAGDADRAWRAAQRTVELDPQVASGLAVHFAYLGDLAHAEQLARYLPAGSPREEVYRAVVRWRKGDLDGAISQLRPIATRSALSADPPIPAPLYLLGEALSESGRDAEAIDALRRFQAMPLLYPSWQLPRSLYFLARSQERVGDRAGARESIAALLPLWSRSSPRQPLLREARALGARLGIR